MEPEELEDEFFMLRVRIDGGALSTEQLRVIGEVSRDFGRDTADLTDRQNIQLHWIRVEDVPAIWDGSRRRPLTTEACGDCPRVVLGSPVAGIPKDELIDPTWAIRRSAPLHRDPDFSNLPRKFKTAITGMPDQRRRPRDQRRVVRRRHTPSSGPASTSGSAAGCRPTRGWPQRLGAFVREEDVPDVWAGVTSVFRDYGYRRMRHKARMKFLVADWGPGSSARSSRPSTSTARCADGPAPAASADAGDHVGVHEQSDGRYYVGSPHRPPAGSPAPS